MSYNGALENASTLKIPHTSSFRDARRYIHNQDWDNAERVAEQHDKSSMSDVLLSRAKVEFEAANYPRFEALMLRCHKPELIVKQYQVYYYYYRTVHCCRYKA